MTADTDRTGLDAILRPHEVAQPAADGTHRPRRERRSIDYNIVGPVCTVAAIVLTAVAVTFHIMTLASAFVAAIALAFIAVWMLLYVVCRSHRVPVVAYIGALVLAFFAAWLFHTFYRYVGMYSVYAVGVYLVLALLVYFSGKLRSSSSEPEQS